jgi:hypothetical protein
MFRIFFLLCLLLTSCQPKLTKAQQIINNDYKFWDRPQKYVFDTFYTMDIVEKEAVEYCNKLKSGKSKDDIKNETESPILDKVNSGKITTDEAGNILFVKFDIQSTGIVSYCPEFSEKVPTLKERLNSK